jgi:hydroxymethylpyrimidine pyrophosphatase-like HAD family hydrolase
MIFMVCMNGELLVNKIPSNSMDFAQGEIMRENTLSRDDVLAIISILEYLTIFTTCLVSRCAPHQLVRNTLA